jgi:hypothetical protein
MDTINVLCWAQMYRLTIIGFDNQDGKEIVRYSMDQFVEVYHLSEAGSDNYDINMNQQVINYTGPLYHKAISEYQRQLIGKESEISRYSYILLWKRFGTKKQIFINGWSWLAVFFLAIFGGGVSSKIRRPQNPEIMEVISRQDIPLDQKKFPEKPLDLVDRSNI